MISPEVVRSVQLKRVRDFCEDGEQHLPQPEVGGFSGLEVSQRTVVDQRRRADQTSVSCLRYRRPCPDST